MSLASQVSALATRVATEFNSVRTAIAAKVDSTRTVSAGTGLTGGGDLSADRTLSVSYGTSAGTATQGDDARVTGAAQTSANLSDLASASTARTNLGLATVATSGAYGDLVGRPAVWVLTLTGTAIQSAVTSLAATGGTAYLLASTYVLTSPVALVSNVVVQGQGEQATTVQQTTAGQDAFTGVDLSHVSLRDMHITGPDSSRSGTAGSGIDLTLSGTAGNATFYVDLDNVYVDYFGLDGVSIATPIVSKLRRVVAFRNNRHGIYTYGSASLQADGTSTHFDACFAAGNYGAGYRLFQMAYSTLTDCAADANGIAYEYDTCVGIVENGCGSEEPYNFDAHQAGYTGLSRHIVNSKVTMNSPYMSNNINIAALITSGSRVVANNLFEGSAGNTDEPTNNPTYSLQVNAGCTVVLNEPSTVTAMSLAAGTTTTLPDAVTTNASALAGKAPLVETVNTVAASGAAQTLPDVAAATIHDVTLTANCTLTFPTPAAGKSFTLVLRQDATGSRTVTWPSGVKWSGGSGPTLSTAAAATDTLSFLSVTGSNWQGFLAGKGMA